MLAVDLREKIVEAKARLAELETLYYGKAITGDDPEPERVQRLHEIRTRLAAATPGTWMARASAVNPERVNVYLPRIGNPRDIVPLTMFSPTKHRNADAELIGNAPVDLAYLCAERAFAGSVETTAKSCTRPHTTAISNKEREAMNDQSQSEFTKKLVKPLSNPPDVYDAFKVWAAGRGEQMRTFTPYGMFLAGWDAAVPELTARALEAEHQKVLARDRLEGQLRICRERIKGLEAAIEQWIDVMDRTGTEREASFKVLTEALQEDFKTAVVTDPDMTDEQRAYWLATSDAEQKAPDIDAAGIAEVEGWLDRTSSGDDHRDQGGVSLSEEPRPAPARVLEDE